jgi:aminopeptidase N
MKKYLFLMLFVFLFLSNSNAQFYKDRMEYSKKHLAFFSKMRNNPSYTLKHSYDVLDYNLDINIYNCFKSPYPNSFSAVEKITFKVDSSLNYIKLDADNNSLTIDTIRLLSGTPLNFNHILNLLTINLDRTYNPGEVVVIIIHYLHNNVYDTHFNVFNGSVYTDCEPEGARFWFPCWDKPTDKATTNIKVKTPSNVLLAGNGRLAVSVRIADTIYYRWISRDPMSTYLVAIAGANNYIVDIRYWHKTSNPTDSIPVRFYHRSNQNLSGIKDTIMMFATYFSSKFGDYPFEKICYADVGTYLSFGYRAMENQTLITLGSNTWNNWFYVPHELAHQWFGDLITCGTWADVWLNEGFSTLCELLAE